MLSSTGGHTITIRFRQMLPRGQVGFSISCASGKIGARYAAQHFEGPIVSAEVSVSVLLAQVPSSTGVQGPRVPVYTYFMKSISLRRRTQSRRRVKGVAERSNLETAAIESVATVRVKIPSPLCMLTSRLSVAETALLLKCLSPEDTFPSTYALFNWDPKQTSSERCCGAQQLGDCCNRKCSNSQSQSCAQHAWPRGTNWQRAELPPYTCCSEP